MQLLLFAGVVLSISMLNLLVAADERIERDALRYIITRGCSTIGEISEAANGKETIERTLELKPEVIVAGKISMDRLSPEDQEIIR